MKLSRIHLALVAAGMSHGMVMADQSASDVGTIGVQGKATAGGGYMVQEESIKARSTVTKEALDKQTATGNAIDKPGTPRALISPAKTPPVFRASASPCAGSTPIRSACR